MNKQHATVVKSLAAITLCAASAAAFAIWQYPQTIVYYTNSSMTQVAGYSMYYCQSSAATLTGARTSYKKVLVAEEDCQNGGMPPLP